MGDIKNDAKGEIFYGMHFYPGVAEYQEPSKDPYRVFLNEDTIRKMDPSFAGRPVFVEHVDGVDDDLNVLKNDADGWVVESFYNQPDGKHWVKFIVCSDKGLRAIKNGMRLSNCYVPQTFAQGGLWNGVSYAKEITGGEYEHLAIVPNPRYEESVIMSPEQFKKYNEDKNVELKRLSNDNQRKETRMKLNFFKKTKVENAIDISEMSVVLPKSGREVSISQLVNDADRVRNDDPPAGGDAVATSLKKAFQEEDGKKKDMNAGMADPDHKVKMHDGSYCNVSELVEKHKALHDELEGIKKKKEDGEDQDEEYEEKGSEVDMASKDKMNKDEKEMSKHETTGVENEEEKKKELKIEDEEDEEKEVKAAKAKNAKEKADRLRNAHLNQEETVTIDLPEDKIARGKNRYGSSK